MGDPMMAALRHGLLTDVGGDVLEIGFGTGLNLPHYPPQVGSLTMVDPNPGMNKLAWRRIAEADIAVAQQVLGGEELPFNDGSLDCVVSTWTLCSIPHAGRAIGEITRVLRPGGTFLFLEDGLAESTSVQRWQHRLTPIQRRLADGYSLNLDIEGLVRNAPFQQVEVERFLMEGTPRLLGSIYRGLAVR